MEVTVIIKLPDGTTRTIELVGANVNTSWGNTYSIDPPTNSGVVGTLSLTGQIKSSSAAESV
jgi:hypothetical protein